MSGTRSAREKNLPSCFWRCVLVGSPADCEVPACVAKHGALWEVAVPLPCFYEGQRVL